MRYLFFFLCQKWGHLTDDFKLDHEFHRIVNNVFYFDSHMTSICVKFYIYPWQLAKEKPWNLANRNILTIQNQSFRNILNINTCWDGWVKMIPSFDWNAYDFSSKYTNFRIVWKKMMSYIFSWFLVYCSLKNRKKWENQRCL